jgi:hypothetical protein
MLAVPFFFLVAGSMAGVLGIGSIVMGAGALG